MTPSAVYDTDVVVSAALYADSLPASLVSLAIAEQVRLFLSPPILEEYTEVLKRPKFQFETRKVNRLLRDLTHAATMVIPESRISASPDESDNRFLECAQADALHRHTKKRGASAGLHKHTALRGFLHIPPRLETHLDLVTVLATPFLPKRSDG